MATYEPTPADTLYPTSSQAPCDELSYDVCVVGGGMAGLCAALSAARNGAKTVLVQDRAVLGGNASSEIRMWVLGAHGPDNKEAGIMEEIRLANLYYNEDRRYSIWDSVLYGLAREQDNLDLILSCAVCEVEMTNPERIAAVKAWHLTRQRWQHISATSFLDCSGDSILRYSGAACRWGREQKEVHHEPNGRDEADRKTMGNSILIQLREIDPAEHRPFVAPNWALKVTDDTFPNRKTYPTGHNFWWLELGGLLDTINDADHLRDDLIALAYGIWAFIKNHPDGRGHAWELEWIGALPGKRENIRYEGDHILTESEIGAGARFDDTVAHGGWTLDDHDPGGIYDSGKGNIHHPAPSPYGIPYRSLYSRTIRNLWFAGRNISATHMAMSSTRVMATCATMGQAAGTAASLAIAEGCDNRAIYENHLDRLQRRLMQQDQWLPSFIRPIPHQTTSAQLSASTGDPSPLCDGIDRRMKDEPSHRWEGTVNDWLQLSWDSPQPISRLRLITDSKLHQQKVMPCSFPLSGNRQQIPSTLLRNARIEISQDGTSWEKVGEIIDNHKRLITWDVAEPLQAQYLRLTLTAGWGDDDNAVIGLFAFEVGECDATGAIQRGTWPTFTKVNGKAGA